MRLFAHAVRGITCFTELAPRSPAETGTEVARYELESLPEKRTAREPKDRKMVHSTGLSHKFGDFTGSNSWGLWKEDGRTMKKLV